MADVLEYASATSGRHPHDRKPDATTQCVARARRKSVHGVVRRALGPAA